VSEGQFRAVYDAHAADLLRFLVRRVEQPEDAADLLSEVFLVWWKRQPDVPSDEARLWLYGVARKVLANYGRGNRRRYRLAVAGCRCTGDAGGA
jgi:RNA polymerase sigma-70 factor (ECF subfamily)